MAHPRTLLLAATVAALVVAGTALAPAARSQVQVAPSWQPAGVASAGTQSTAWFHEPAARQVVACTTVNAGSPNASVQCVAGRLP